MIFRLIYCSLNCIRGSAEEVAREIELLLEVSRENNKRTGVTGVLLFSGLAFAQVLEGEPEAVQALYAKICKDKRNDNVFLISEETTAERMFPRWAMAYVDDNNLRSLPGAELVPRKLYADPKAGAAQLVDWLKKLVVTEEDAPRR